MPTSLIFAIILIALCILYGIAAKAYSKPDLVYETEAGSLSGTAGKNLDVLTEKAQTLKLPDGRLIRTRDYIRIKVRGRCMAPRNILDGEEWLVEPVSTKKPLEKQIKPNDVLLLYIDDLKCFKIREFADFENGELKTGHYETGEFQFSSANHKPEQVMGIVKYAI